MPKNKKIRQGKQLGINGIVIFFSICTIILGICMISGSVYARAKINETVKSNKTPEVQIDRNDDNNTIEIRAEHIRGISKIEYSWNNEEIKTINTNNQTKILETIDLIGGTNELTVKVIDETGKSTIGHKTYTVGNIPELILEAVENGVRITTESEEKIDYIVYKWDDGEEKEIQVNKTKYEGIINAPKGKHTLKIEVVDINGIKASKEQTVVGTTIPTVTIKADIIDGKLSFVVSAEDEEEISKVKIKLNGEEIEEEVNAKTYNKNIEMKQGENVLIITAYNKNGFEASRGAKFNNE